MYSGGLRRGVGGAGRGFGISSKQRQQEAEDSSIFDGDGCTYDLCRVKVLCTYI